MMSSDAGAELKLETRMIHTCCDRGSQNFWHTMYNMGNLVLDSGLFPYIELGNLRILSL